jgi:hypothetical protein
VARPAVARLVRLVAVGRGLVVGRGARLLAVPAVRVQVALVAAVRARVVAHRPRLAAVVGAVLLTRPAELVAARAAKARVVAPTAVAAVAVAAAMATRRAPEEPVVTRRPAEGEAGLPRRRNSAHEMGAGPGAAGGVDRGQASGAGDDWFGCRCGRFHPADTKNRASRRIATLPAFLIDELARHVAAHRPGGVRKAWCSPRLWADRCGAISRSGCSSPRSLRRG